MGPTMGATVAEIKLAGAVDCCDRNEVAMLPSLTMWQIREA
jgi:hypothetical protein